MTAGEEYRFERIGQETYHHLVALVRNCFGKKITLEHVRAKYDTSRFGAADIGYLAMTAEGIPAAYYGVFPIHVEIDQVVHLAAQSGDTMTDPAHQKRGLFIRLANVTYELAKQSGVRFIFGFPNANSLPGFERKLGWSFSGELQDFKFLTGAFPLCEAAERWPVLRPIHSAWVTFQKGEVRAMTTDERVGSFGGSVLHDRKFFNYKEGLGAFWVERAGIRFLVHPNVHLYIGEILLDDPSVGVDVAMHLKALGRRFLCRQAVCTFSTGHPLFSVLTKQTVSQPGLKIGYLDLGSGLPLDRMSYSRSDLDTF